MNLVITTQNRYDRTPDGAVWSSTGMAYGYWTRYLDVFEHVQVTARLQTVSQAAPGAVRADGEGVSVCGVPYFVGPVQMISRAMSVWRALGGVAQAGDAVILRIPSQMASLLRRRMVCRELPYAVEVIADPFEQFGPGVHHVPGMRLIRLISLIEMRLDCRKASVAAYVTQNELQKRYPCPGGMFGVSDVDLDPAAFADGPKRFAPAAAARKWLLVGSLHHGQKGTDLLLRAMASLRDSGAATGRDATLTVIGDGPERAGLIDLACSLGLADRVRFPGSLPGHRDVRKCLAEADLFILPSRSEGLPRAMLEAMAMGLPCIGTRVGGVPEILQKEAIVPPADLPALAAKLNEVCDDAARLNALAAENYKTAGRFRKERLRPALRAFLERVREKSVRYPSVHAH
ncbi:MAG TPA: glycosyltransferase [Candidatus Ozemobacteraceae bacterium]|nr:glycosyltransferase [Candidatus Ozemobacteraceae bacterium]